MNVVTIKKLLDVVENDAGLTARICIERVLEKIITCVDPTLLTMYGSWIYGIIFYLWTADKIDYQTFRDLDTFVSELCRK